MSRRFRMALLVRRRVASILKDSDQLRDLTDHTTAEAVHDLRRRLTQALGWAQEVEDILLRQGEGEDDGT